MSAAVGCRNIEFSKVNENPQILSESGKLN